MPTVEYSVNTQANDGYVVGSLAIYASSGPAFGKSSATYTNDAWVLFTGVTLPVGAIIDVAYLRFRSSGDNTVNTCNARIRGNDTANPAAPTTIAEYNALVGTTAYVDWNDIPDWFNNVQYDSPSIVSIIEELLASYDYSAGRNMQFTIKNNGSSSSARRVGSSITAPPTTILHIEYHLPGLKRSFAVIVG